MAYILESKLKSWNLAGKRVFVRADLNVPIHDGTNTNDYRLRQVQQTLDFIIDHGGSVVLASHLGRPTKPDKNYSLQTLVPWFRGHGYSILFAESISQTHSLVQSLTPGNILLLENLRFFPGEQKNDIVFAQTLAELADYYIDDAFGTLHRNESSIALLPRFFNENNRTIGLLVEHELAMLNKLLINPTKPFLLILGGCKVTDKIKLIEHLLPHVDTILLCPAIAFSFMQAVGLSVGKSLIDEHSGLLCREILEKAQKRNVMIHMPIDCQIADSTLDGKLSFVDARTMPQESIGISIGPNTIELYRQEIAQAKTIFYNGLMGFVERPETLHGTQSILEAMAQSKAYTVIGGGDTVGAAESLGIAHALGYCSTGGGATLAYLSGQPLPGIEALIKPCNCPCESCSLV